MHSPSFDSAITKLLKNEASQLNSNERRSLLIIKNSSTEEVVPDISAFNATVQAQKKASVKELKLATKIATGYCAHQTLLRDCLVEFSSTIALTDKICPPYTWKIYYFSSLIKIFMTSRLSMTRFTTKSCMSS